MPKKLTHPRLSKHDIKLIAAVLAWAYREGRTLAESVEHRLGQNEVALSMFRKGEPMYRAILAETRRIVRLQRRFASWQPGAHTEPCSGTPRPVSQRRDRAGKE